MSTKPSSGKIKRPSCRCAARIRAELPDIRPSAGHDEVDEVLGLLRVARKDLQALRDELRLLRARLADPVRQTTLIPDIHACKKCGNPGAVMHWPGGYLCPNGCKEFKLPTHET